MEMTEKIWEKPDLLVQTGSRLYGCASPESDVDTRGFFVEPAEYLLGRKQFNCHETKEPDCTIWCWRAFCKSLEKCNPQAVEMLFVPEENVLAMTDKGKLLVSHRDIYLTTKCLKTFGGFSASEWRHFSTSHERQNFKRAYHAIRLLKEAIELLGTGKLTFPRPEKELLVQIRNGEVSQEDLNLMFETLNEEMNEAEKASVLPETTDRGKLDALFYAMIEDEMYKFSSRRVVSTHSTF